MTCVKSVRQVRMRRRTASALRSDEDATRDPRPAIDAAPPPLSRSVRRVVVGVTSCIVRQNETSGSSPDHVFMFLLTLLTDFICANVVRYLFVLWTGVYFCWCSFTLCCPVPVLCFILFFKRFWDIDAVFDSGQSGKFMSTIFRNTFIIFLILLIFKLFIC